MKKVPPVGSVVRVKWLDSGATTTDSVTAPDKEVLFRAFSYGKLVHVNKERIVLEQNWCTDDPELKIRHYGDRHMIATNCIEHIKVYERPESEKRSATKRKTK